MTINIPDDGSPRGEALVAAIEAGIRDGDLAPGERLPSQRALAHRLGLAIGTVTRAYAEAERRGLVVGEVGRGTFVRGAEAAPSVVPGPRSASDVDLGNNVSLAVPDVAEPLHRACVEQLVRSGELTSAIERPDEAAGLDVARRWLARVGIERDAARVAVAPGFHPALIAVLSALCRPGDTVLCESLAYSGLPACARGAGVHLVGVDVDDRGVVPEDVDRRAERHGARVLVVQPTHHSPTTATMDDARRRALLEVAARRGLTVVEFDEDLALADDATPLANLAPETVVTVADVGRALGLGLRVCAVAAPDAARRDAIARALADVAWMTSPLPVAVTGALLDDGADALLAARREALAERQRRIARLDGVGGARLVHRPTSHHAWLDLTSTAWSRSEAFVAAAAERHVIVSDAHVFHVGPRTAPSAVRLALGTATDAELDQAIDVIAELLARSSAPPTRL